MYPCFTALSASLHAENTHTLLVIMPRRLSLHWTQSLYCCVRFWIISYTILTQVARAFLGAVVVFVAIQFSMRGGARERPEEKRCFYSF